MAIPSVLEDNPSYWTGPKGPGGTKIRQQHEKAFTLITVGLMTEPETVVLPDGKNKTGFRFWYSIVSYQVSRKQKILRPTKEFEHIDSATQYWQEMQDEYAKQQSGKEYKERLRVRGLEGKTDQERFQDAKKRQQEYRNKGLDPTSRDVTMEEKEEIIGLIGPTARGDFVKTTQEKGQGLAKSLYTPTGTNINPSHVEKIKETPSKVLGEPSSEDEIIDYFKDVEVIREAVSSEMPLEQLNLKPDYLRLIRVLREAGLSPDEINDRVKQAVLPRWLSNSHALVRPTVIDDNRWLFNREDLEGGEVLDELEARKRAIYGMLIALRSRFWTLNAPAGYEVSKEWPDLHQQLMQSLVTAKLNIRKLIAEATQGNTFDTSVVAVGILTPTGIDEIFDSTQEAFSYIEQTVAGEDESLQFPTPLQQAATLGSKMKITAEKAKILLEAASILEEADPRLATAVDHVLINALDKQQMTEAEIVKGLLRIANKLDENGASKEARLADSIVNELVQKKI